MAERYATGKEPVVDAPTYRAQVVAVRFSRTAVLRMASDEGDEWESDVPLRYLPEGTKNGTRLIVTFAKDEN